MSAVPHIVAAQEPAIRTPPHNIDAERSLLGSVFIKPAAFDQVAACVQVDDLFMPTNRLVFEAMLAVRNRQQPIDVITVGDELRTRDALARLDGGEAYLLALANAVPTAENVLHYARIVREKAAQRRLIAICADVGVRAHQQEDAAIVIEDARRSLAQIQSRTTDWDIPTIAEVAAAQTEPLPDPISTGLAALDAQLGGGLFTESVYPMPGPTGRGKSGLALQIASHASLTMPVLYIGTELKPRQVQARVVAQILGRPWLELWRQAHVERDPIQSALEDRRLFVVDGAARRDASPCQLADRIAQRTGQVPLLVVDYLQKLARRRADGPDGYRFTVAAISDEIGMWTCDTGGTALVISSAANSWGDSAAGEREIRDFAASTKESGDVGFDAAALLFVDTGVCPPGGVTKATIKVAKNRYYTSGKIELEFDGAIGLFRPISTGQTTPGSAVLTDLEQKILDAVKSGKFGTKTAIVDEVGGKRAEAFSAIKKLIERRVLTEDLRLGEEAF